MSYAEKIIERFGGTRKAASRLGLPPSTVQSWKDAGRIPAKHQPDVLHAAQEDNLGLTEKDFFPRPFDGGGKEASAAGAGKRP